MPVVRPCIVGRMGSTTFYETTMTGRELASTVRPAKETDAWASASIEERMQRTFDVRRIRETIVPYLARHPDRFFGSLIVLAPKGAIEFEPLATLIHEPLSAAYRDSARHMGFLTIEHDELVALDGQHRLLAYREIVAGGPQLGAYAGEAVDDEVSILLIEFENAQKTRRIFNKVNRHARPDLPQRQHHHQRGRRVRHRHKVVARPRQRRTTRRALDPRRAGGVGELDEQHPWTEQPAPHNRERRLRDRP